MKRLEGIGGTDASCVMGAGFKTPYGLWEQKTNRVGDTFSNEAMRWGTELESVIRSRFAEETGRIVETVDPIQNPKADWWVGSPDGISFDENRENPRGLEIKTARFKDEKWGEPGTNQIPPGYYIQCQWYMVLLQVEVFDVAVLFSGQDFEVFTIHKDEKVLKTLYKKCKKFWEENVLKDIPPEEMSLDERSRFLNVKYANPNDTIKLIEEDDEENDVLSAMESLVYIKKEIKELETKKKELEQEVKREIGEDRGIQSTLYRALWSPQTKKSMDQSRFKAMVADEIGSKRTQEIIEECQKESSFRVLRMTERKQ